MSRSSVLILLVAGLAAQGCADRQSSRPDVIVLTIDTLRPDRLGIYGNRDASTPRIDALGERGRLYTQATTPFPRTTPAIATLFTGLWPHHHGSREVGQAMQATVTLATRLRALGYRTVGISSTDVLSERQKIDLGFDTFRERSRHAREVSDEALRQVASAGDGAPLFLWAHYFDPHFPYAPWPGAGEPPPAPECERLVRDLVLSRTLSWEDVQGDRDGRSRRARADCVRLYDAEIAFVDREIGRLLDGLAASRPGRRRLIVLTADHGENLGEDGLYYEHGPSLHDAGLRIPLILAGPGVPPGRDGGVARLEDVLPTLLALLGIRGGPPMDGVDLFSPRPGERVSFAESGSAMHPRYTGAVSAGRRGGARCVHGERYSLCGEDEPTKLFDHIADPGFTRDLGATRPAEWARLERAWKLWPAERARERAVRTPSFKLVERPSIDGGYTRALYRLPAESRDVQWEHPGVAARLGRLLDAWTAALSPPDAGPGRNESDLERLRSLGYVQ